MTAGNLAWWNAMMAVNQFDTGSLVLVDDTLNVEGGGTVDLRVRLGARPRSDVTVALSETSALISLATDSLTFTQDNWDTFQSVTATAPGNSQSISLPSNLYVYASSNSQWGFDAGSRPVIDAALRAQADTTLWIFRVRQNGSLHIELTGQNNNTRRDLTDAFETNGSVMVTAGTDTVTAALAGADMAEPYDWTPSNSAEVTAFFNALPTMSGNQAATLVIRDYTPGDAMIALSASGPAEYSGVSSAATVTVN